MSSHWKSLSAPAVRSRPAAGANATVSSTVAPRREGSPRRRHDEINDRAPDVRRHLGLSRAQRPIGSAGNADGSARRRSCGGGGRRRAQGAAAHSARYSLIASAVLRSDRHVGHSCSASRTSTSPWARSRQRLVDGREGAMHEIALRRLELVGEHGLVRRRRLLFFNFRGLLPCCLRGFLRGMGAGCQLARVERV